MAQYEQEEEEVQQEVEIQGQALPARLFVASGAVCSMFPNKESTCLIIGGKDVESRADYCFSEG